MPARASASIAFACLALLGCGASRPSDVVVFASGSDLESANPLVTIHPLSRQVQRHALFVTLVRYDDQLRLRPYFARSWDWTSDRRTLHLSLYPSLRWHDGELTTSRDVAFTLRAARDARTGYARAGDLAAMHAVTTPSDSEVVIHFDNPQREVPQLFTELPVLPRHLLDSVPLARMRQAAFNTAPVGNGPFRFVSRVVGQRWTFERNADFPRALGGPPSMRRLVIAVVDEPTTKFAGLASGDLDFAGISPTMAALAGRDPTIRVVDYPVLFTTSLIFNTRRGPLADVRVRQAISASIDRPRIIQAALAGYGTPAAGPVPPESPLSDSAGVQYNPAVADSLLDAAGLRRAATGKRPIALELLTVGSGDNAVEQLIQADLEERGITVAIRQLELAAFLAQARAREKQFDVLITGVPGDLSLAYLRAMFASSDRGGSLDYADYHSAALDAAFARAQAASDEARLRAAWRDVQATLAREMPAAWLYHSRGVQGVSARMHGVVMDLRGELATVSAWTTAARPMRALAGR